MTADTGRLSLDRPPLAEVLGRYAVEAAAAQPDVLEEARSRVVDSLGVALAGLMSPPARAARRYALESRPSENAGPGAQIWGTLQRGTPENAAFANGVALRYLDWNDAYFGRGGSHPSDVISGLMAVGQTTGSTGRELLEAIAIAYEVIGDLTDSFCVHDQGWDHVNVTALGAVCGVARLLGLDAEQAGHAVALTAVPHGAMRQTRFGQLSMWKGAAAADAVRHAIYAGTLAMFGMHGPESAFEGTAGFIQQLLGGKPVDEAPLQPLVQSASPHRLLDSHVKRWPFGYVAQSGVAAALQLHPEVGPFEQIRRVTITTYPVAVHRMVSPEKYTPTTRETADHSLPYVVAAALKDGKVDTATFEPAAFGDERMHEFLQSSVDVVVTDEFTAAYPAAFPTRVEVHLADGRHLSAEVWHPPGHAKNRLSADEAREKFFDAAEQVVEHSRAARVLRAAEKLDRSDDLEELSDALSFPLRDTEDS